jgi:hypothetical protein
VLVQKKRAASAAAQVPTLAVGPLRPTPPRAVGNHAQVVMTAATIPPTLDVVCRDAPGLVLAEPLHRHLPGADAWPSGGHPLIRIDNHLEFSGALNRKVNYEPFSCGGPCWVDDRCNALNVGVGISMPGPQCQWSIGLGLGHLFEQGPVVCNAQVYTRRRGSPGEFLLYRPLSVKWTAIL